MLAISENDANGYECTDATHLEEQKIILKPCQICGRTFNPKSLERHEKICATAKKSNHRTVFNSFMQRAKELNATPASSEKQREDRIKSKGKSKESNENSGFSCRKEKKQSIDLLNNGLSLQKTVPPGYKKCPSCLRCFNIKAADRHITWCLEQQTRLPNTPPNSEALERLKARVKYRAPLPRKNNHGDSKRLVKSADSVRELSILHTHSSSSGPLHNIPSKQTFMNSCIPLLMQQKRANSCNALHASNRSPSQESLSKGNVKDLKNKKSVKFKEKFSVCDEERNKNLDILAALKLRLSELKTSDDFLEECIRSNGNKSKNSRNYSFPAPTEMCRDIWTSDGDIHCNTSSSSDAPFPTLNHVDSSEQRLPRFCYNCGTKYPIVSAKFCCECGARRFVFGSNDNELQVV